MKRLSIWFLFVLFSSQTFSQGYIGFSNDKAHSEFKKYSIENNLRIVVKESHSTLVMLVNDPAKQPLEVILHFDKSGKCDSETKIANCDSCFYKYLNHSLNKHKLGWIKITYTQYMSKYQKRLILEMTPNNISYSYVIRRMNWNMREYRKMPERKGAEL